MLGTEVGAKGESRAAEHAGWRAAASISSVVVVLAVAALSLVACGGQSEAEDAPVVTASTEVPAENAEPAESAAAESATPAPEEEPVVLSPASIVASDQVGSGQSIVIDAVTLPAPGFVVVHLDDNGFPGLTIAVSELLDAGSYEDLTVDIRTPLTAAEVLLPMLHIDVDASGFYEETEPPGFVDESAESDMAITMIQYDIG